MLRVCGKIDRIDRRADGGLVLRDYKTGRAPKDDGGVFRGGRQLQIPFYVPRAAELLPGRECRRGLPRLRGRRPAGRLPARAGARPRVPPPARRAGRR